MPWIGDHADHTSMSPGSHQGQDAQPESVQPTQTDSLSQPSPAQLMPPGHQGPLSAQVLLEWLLIPLPLPSLSVSHPLPHHCNLVMNGHPVNQADLDSVNAAINWFHLSEGKGPLAVRVQSPNHWTAKEVPSGGHFAKVHDKP